MHIDLHSDILSFIEGNSKLTFEDLSIQIFRYQAQYNNIYRTYTKQLKIDISKVKAIEQIPFLPIEFFKTHEVITLPQLSPKGRVPDDVKRAVLFTSSGTTGDKTSKHHVVDVNLYKQSFKKCFEFFYGDIRKYCVLALLPSYLEREGSSLIYMTEQLIKDSKNINSGFYLNNTDELITKLTQLKDQKILLLGVTYALLDLAELTKGDLKLKNTIIMETGGMKGRCKPARTTEGIRAGGEMVREEVHQILTTAFGVKEIHSEYGMTELLSQAYSNGHGLFACPPWMNVLIRDMNDPLTLSAPGKTGGINVIDLANIYSCSFIATQDLGKLHQDNTFEVLGRFDNSDVRGCNMLL